MRSTIADIIKALEQPEILPHEVYYVPGGLYEQQQIAFKGMLTVFIAAVTLVFVLLLYLYEQFHVALAMLLTTLSAMAVVFGGLWLTNTELNITAMMGMMMVINCVMEAGVFYYSEYERLLILAATKAPHKDTRYD